MKAANERSYERGESGAEEGNPSAGHVLLEQEVLTMKQQPTGCPAQQEAIFRENESLKIQVHVLKKKKNWFTSPCMNGFFY